MRDSPPNGTNEAENHQNQNATPPTTIETQTNTISAVRGASFGSEYNFLGGNTSTSSARSSARSLPLQRHANANSNGRHLLQDSSASTASHINSSTYDAVSRIRDEPRFDEQQTILQMEVHEDADGLDSDEEGEEFEIFNESFVKSSLSRMEDEAVATHVHEISTGSIAFVIAKKEMDVRGVDFSEKIIKAPDDWIRPQARASNEPSFDSLDNPGKWSDYIFRPVYKKERVGNQTKYNYIRHELPTGCTPVPLATNGKRMCNGWEFFYDGWKSKKIRLLQEMGQLPITYSRRRGWELWMATS